MYACVPLEALWWIDGAAMQALLTRRVDESAQGDLQGAIAALQSVASLIAPPLFSLTYAHFIEPGRATPVPGAPFYLASALMLASLLTAWRVTRRDSQVPVRSLESLGEA
jgi:DHA1 family tetracycline resistance protein-like MFS transporter